MTACGTEQISSSWRRDQRAALDATPIMHPTATVLRVGSWQGQPNQQPFPTAKQETNAIPNHNTG